MNAKKTILKLLIIILIITILPITSLAKTVEEEVLSIQEHRYIDGEKKQGYALNNEGQHPIFQIMSSKDNSKTNYYCLNATAGATWNEEGRDVTNSDVTYKSYYNLDLKSDIEELVEDTDPVYSKISGKYFNQIWWILNNLYIPTGEETKDEAEKEKLLSAAGIVSSEIKTETLESINGDDTNNAVKKAYKYIPQSEFENYLISQEGSAIGDAKKAEEGWYYINKQGEYTRVDIPDELIEIAAQAAIWYYTNYLNVEEADRSEEFNIRKQGLQLLCSYEDSLEISGTVEEDIAFSDWKPLKEEYIEETNVENKTVNTGMWMQDQATILCWYLIDAADMYAVWKENNIEKEEIPLVITKPEEEIEIISKHLVNSQESYIIGPVKIDEVLKEIYTLEDEIIINDKQCNDFKILSRETLQTSTDTKLSDKIGQEFYISVPISWIQENLSDDENSTLEFNMQFTGTYKANKKKLWKFENAQENLTEQPVVEVVPYDEKFILEVKAKMEDTPVELQGEFDLALQKYISEIYSNGIIKQERNEAKVDTSVLASGKSKTAKYIQDKTPINVKNGDYVVYTFTVYNEGDIDGYVNKIRDNIPKGLEFIYIAEDGETIIACDSEGNTETLEVDKKVYDLINEYNTSWALDSDGTGLLKDTYNGEQTISVSCDVENFLGTRKVLKLYNGAEDKNLDGSNLDNLSVKLVLRVSEEMTGITKRNEGAITDVEDTNGNKQDLVIEGQEKKGLEDRDSEVINWLGKDGNKNYQDDEDYDNVIIGKVDLALIKFITAVSSDTEIEDGDYITADKHIGSKENPYLREAEVDTTPLKTWTPTSEKHDAIYKMNKKPLLVPASKYVLYNIRVFNEGDGDVYAGEIKHHLPEYLDYVDCEYNKTYRWNLQSDGKTLVTDYLSYEVDEENNLIKAYNREKDDGTGSGLDYRDVQILCRVNENTPTNKTLINVAQVSKYEDDEGKNIPRDEDSISNNVDKKSEDDNDYEKVLVQTFDLSLLNWVSTIYKTENEETKTTETENTGNDETDIIPKVEINKKKIDTTLVKFEYTIKVTNEGDIAGYAKEIKDYVPEGLKFYEEDNSGWTDEGNNVISTRLLEDTLLEPGESATVTVILRWINGKDNLNLKTNIAEISEDYNEYKIPDRDSIPESKKNGEDDVGYAKVLLGIATGITGKILQIGTGLVLVIVILSAGIILIKKYVL